jgi:hypothetical protein
MLNCLTESGREIPIRAETEVLVAGAGIAGVSAALAAARHGKKVMLLEREFSLGGMATLGLITIYLPLCDGKGHQLVFGHGEELLRLSIKYGYEGNYPTAWLDGGSEEERISHRFMAQFNPQMFALTMEQLLLSAGVDILYGTLVTDTVVEDGLIKAVVVENKSGRTAIAVESVIDCTGDADICHLSGAPTVLNETGNRLASSYYYYSGSEVKLKMFGLADVVPDKQDNTDANGNDPYTAEKTASLDQSFRFSGVDGYELSRAVLTAHRKMFDDILAQKEKNTALMPVTMSTIPLVRMSRRIAGLHTMEESEDHVRLPDSVGMTGDWCKRGPAYEIPFGALHCAEVRNLLAAGRDISTSQAMWNVTRVIPPCAVSGQAAGTAAALGSDFMQTDIAELQRVLEADGVKLHF